MSSSSQKLLGVKVYWLPYFSKRWAELATKIRCMPMLHNRFKTLEVIEDIQPQMCELIIEKGMVLQVYVALAAFWLISFENVISTFLFITMKLIK